MKKKTPISELIQFVSNYNGEIKEINIADKNSRKIDANITIKSNYDNIKKFFDNTKNEEGIYKITRIDIENEQKDDMYSLDIDIQFEI